MTPTVIPSSSSTRRRFLVAAAASACVPALLSATRALGGETASKPFSFDLLTEEARARAAGPVPQAEAIPQVFAEMTYDDYNFIAYRPARARWNKPGVTWRMMPFHLGWLFKEPVHLYEVTDGMATEMTFTTDDFEYRHRLKGIVPPGTALPGVAGFKLYHQMNRGVKMVEVISFIV